MRSNSSREEIAVAVKALTAALETVLKLDFEALITPECFTMLQHCEKLRRQPRTNSFHHPGKLLAENQDDEDP